MNLYRMIGLLSCYLFSNYTCAALDYISLHDIELNTPNALAIKLNIVESQDKSSLKFVLQQAQYTQELSYQRLNQYMLRVKGNRGITDKATLTVYTSIDNDWKKFNHIIITDTSIQTTPSNNSNVSAKTSAQSPEEITRKIPGNRPNQKPSAELSSTNMCLLIRNPQETLWSLATRYAKQWNIDVYGTMIAIYSANKTQFHQQHIKRLKDNAQLTCPSKNIMTSLGSKNLMEEEFERLHNASH